MKRPLTKVFFGDNWSEMYQRTLSFIFVPRPLFLKPLRTLNTRGAPTFFWLREPQRTLCARMTLLKTHVLGLSVAGRSEKLRNFDLCPKKAFECKNLCESAFVCVILFGTRFETKKKTCKKDLKKSLLERLVEEERDNTIKIIPEIHQGTPKNTQIRKTTQNVPKLCTKQIVLFIKNTLFRLL